MAGQGIDLEAVKQGQQRMWSQGDFSRIATVTQIVAENLCETADIVPGSRVLDVACGSGNTAIAAARRFTEVIGIDYVPALLERARERASAERLEVDFREGDAEALKFEDESFDFVLSTFGAMFAPDHSRTAAELLRVCRSGGKVGMSNWTPESFVGQVFATTSSFLFPDGPPPGVQPPPLWGTEQHLRDLFGEGVRELSTEPCEFVFRFHSPEQWGEFFRTYFGPTKVAFEAAGDRADDFAEELLGLARRFNRAGDRAMVVPAEYVDVVAIKA